MAAPVTIVDPLTNQPIAWAGRVPGLPMSMNSPFSRMGPPVIISVTPTSAATAVPVDRPDNAAAFFFENPNPFMVYLVGTPRPSEGGDPPLVQASPTNAWRIPPGIWGPFGTVDPAKVSAYSVDFPLWNRAEFNFIGRAGSGELILQYGNGF